MKILKHIVTGLLLMLMVGGTVFASFDEAQLQEVKQQLETVIQNDKRATNCRDKLVPLYDVEMIEFFQFLETNFQNKSANTSLVNIAIVRYRSLKTRMQGYLAQLAPARSSEGDITTFSAEFEAFNTCGEVTDLYLDLAKEKMIEHIKSTNYQKKTTIFVEKYRSINDQLRNMNFELAQTQGFFVTFKNKLPGFLSACIGS